MCAARPECQLRRAGEIDSCVRDIAPVRGRFFIRSGERAVLQIETAERSRRERAADRRRAGMRIVGPRAVDRDMRNVILILLNARVCVKVIAGGTDVIVDGETIVKLIHHAPQIFETRLCRFAGGLRGQRRDQCERNEDRRGNRFAHTDSFRKTRIAQLKF